MSRKLICAIVWLTSGMILCAAQGQSVRVNFQANSQGSREVPVGYLPDYGDIFGDRGNGWSYGWTVDKTASGRDRDMSTDQRLDTNNSLVMWNTGTGSWEIDVPNGTYNLFIVGGDPGYLDSTQSYLLEDTITITDPTPYPPGNTTGNRYDEYHATVTVEDGRLTIAPDPATTGYIKISYVDIADVRLGQVINPPDRGLWQSTEVVLEWTPGLGATQHDVYLGESFNDVNAATPSTPGIYMGRQSQAKYPASSTMTLDAGKTYYWRIDEVSGKDVLKGDIWNFKVQLLTAYDPQPFDGYLFVDPNVVLGWTKGATASSHVIYFGDNYDQVENATTATVGIYKKTQLIGQTTYDPPGSLVLGKTYYWRIDEKAVGGVVYKGDVWSFTIATRYGEGLKGQYFANQALSGDPVLIRTDRQINFDWGSNSPDASVPGDGFSVRWTGQVEIPATGEWTFFTHTDDSVRLWVNGVRLVNRWGTDNPLLWDSNSISLREGFYPVMMEYYESTQVNHIAIATLWWQGPLVPERQPIPAGAFSPPLAARSPNPGHGVTEVSQTPAFLWTAGDRAVEHDVYFGASFEDVNAAQPTTAGIYRGRQALENTRYIPAETPLAWDTTYYWRVDEVNGVKLWKGSVWSFTTAPFKVVDDFENYDDLCDRIFYAWVDGFGITTAAECGAVTIAGNGSGSTVGNFVPPYTEQAIVHGGLQAMPLDYDNTKGPFNSEAVREWTVAQDWTEGGMNTLTLYVQGNPAAFAENSSGAIIMSGAGTDIWSTSDEFRFAYKQLKGNGSIVARVDRVANTNGWAKAGVMIRETLNADSKNVIAAVTPSNGVTFQWRTETAMDSNSAPQSGLQAPYWVKITRTGNTFTAECSADGTTWTSVGTDPAASSATITMASDVYIGLAVTSHAAEVLCGAQFSSVSSQGTGEWQTLDVGIGQSTGNAPDTLYVVLEDSAGHRSVVSHPDRVVIATGVWEEWAIPMSRFTSEQVDASKIKKMTLGIGDQTGSMAGGAGRLIIDDVRVTRVGP